MNQNTKVALIIGGVIIAALILVPLIWGARSGWDMHGDDMMGNFGWWWFMPIFGIIFWVLIIWAVVALIRGLASGGSDLASNRSDSALEVLKKRYARGEISKEEFEEKKKDLQS